MAVDAGAPYGEARAANQEDKRAVLAAMASGGTAAADAVRAAQTRIDTSKQNAVAQALQESRQFNAPEEAQQIVTNNISAPYNLRNDSLAQGQAARASDMATRGAADSAYFDKIDASIPFSQDRARTAYDTARARIDAQNAVEAQRANMEQQIAFARLQADKDSQKFQQDQAEREFNYKMAFDKQQFDEDVRRFGIQEADKLAAQRASAARSGGRGGGGGGGSSSTGFLGLGLGNKGEAVSQLIAGIGSAAGRLNGTPGSYIGSANAAENMPHTQFVARLIDQQQGLPTGTVYNAIGGKKAFAVPPLPPSPAAKVNVQSDPVYQTVSSFVAGALNGDADSLAALNLDPSRRPTLAAVRSAILNSPNYAQHKAALDAVIADNRL